LHEQITRETKLFRATPRVTFSNQTNTMPYIKQTERKKFDPTIKALISELKKSDFNEGNLNYIMSKMINAAFDARPSYANINKVMGVLNCVQHEFYRRKAVAYEEVKIKENGDI